MKTYEVITYTIEELKKQFPEGYKRAIEVWRDDEREIPWMEETVESLKKLIEATEQITLKDWNLGAYNRNNHIRIAFREDNAEMLEGKRAFAWLENNLLSKLRIPWKGKAPKYGKGYRAGMVKPCPFTGYCADEDYLQDLTENIKGGMNLKDAFTSLADTCERLLEQECEYAHKEETIVENMMANMCEFTEDGKLY